MKTNLLIAAVTLAVCAAAVTVATTPGAPLWLNRMAVDLPSPFGPFHHVGEPLALLAAALGAASRSRA